MSDNRHANHCDECSTSIAGLVAGLFIGAVTFGTALAASAQSASAPSPAFEAPAPYPRLARELDAHFQITYWRNPRELENRQMQHAEVTESWRNAKRSEANDRAYHAWMRMAIRNSMPGAGKPLPPLPRFEYADIAEQSTSGGSLPDDRTSGNPFRDDP